MYDIHSLHVIVDDMHRQRREDARHANASPAPTSRRWLGHALIDWVGQLLRRATFAPSTLGSAHQSPGS